MAKLEFYVGNADNFIATLEDGAVPRSGEFISIEKTTYEVVRITWAIDHSDTLRHRTLRANVVLKEADSS